MWSRTDIEVFSALTEIKSKSATRNKSMKAVVFVLNIPWSLLGLLCGLLSLPKNIRMDKFQFLLVVNVKRLWINEIFLGRKAKGFTAGNTVLLSDASDNGTYNHEIVHARQFMKMPLIFPLFYCAEYVKNGYQGNKYEKEANLFVDKSSLNRK